MTQRIRPYRQELSRACNVLAAHIRQLRTRQRVSRTRAAAAGHQSNLVASCSTPAPTRLASVGRHDMSIRPRVYRRLAGQAERRAGELTQQSDTRWNNLHVPLAALGRALVVCFHGCVPGEGGSLQKGRPASYGIEQAEQVMVALGDAESFLRRLVAQRQQAGLGSPAVLSNWKRMRGPSADPPDMLKHLIRQVRQVMLTDLGLELLAIVLHELTGMRVVVTELNPT